MHIRQKLLVIQDQQVFYLETESFALQGLEGDELGFFKAGIRAELDAFVGFPKYFRELN